MIKIWHFLRPLRPLNQGLMALPLALLASASSFAQDTVEWTTLGNDFEHTRSTDATQITAENFADLEVAWEWDGASFNGYSGRSTPTYVDGKLYTVSGPRRNVVAIDPKTGCLLYTSPSPRD